LNSDLFSKCITIPENGALKNYFELSQNGFERVFVVKSMLKSADPQQLFVKFREPLLALPTHPCLQVMIHYFLSCASCAVNRMATIISA